jgi:hypothetical protein
MIYEINKSIISLGVELGIVLAWKPEYVSLDFEMGAIQAFLFCFPTIKIIGCWFHFGQCLFRKIVEIGLKTQYGDDEDLKKYIYIYYNIYNYNIKCLNSFRLVHC